MLALVVLAGCGDDGPSRDAWRAQADAICAPALRQLRGVAEGIDAAGAGNDPPAIYARSATLTRQGARILRTTFDRIEALDRPSDSRITAWIAANRRQAAMTTALAAAYDKQDQTVIARLSEQLDEVDSRNDAAAAKLGLTRCAERVRR